jgi:hypothetical protein
MPGEEAPLDFLITTTSTTTVTTTPTPIIIMTTFPPCVIDCAILKF